MGNPNGDQRNLLRTDQQQLIGPTGPIGRSPESNVLPRRKKKQRYQGGPQGLRETPTPTAPTPDMMPDVSTMPRMRFGGMLGGPTASLGMGTGLMGPQMSPLVGGMEEGLGPIASPRFGGGSPMLNNIRNRFLSSTGLGMGMRGMNQAPYGRRSIY